MYRTAGAEIDNLHRHEWGRIVATLIRLLGDWDVAEEAAQEAFIAAAEQWPAAGVPEYPRSWIIQTARHKAIDRLRRRTRHEAAVNELALTEARRSVMDLRASALEGQDLAAALESGARQWTAGSGVKVDVQAAAPADPLPEEMEQHLLRIAQEAVTNVVKHAGARPVLPTACPTPARCPSGSTRYSRRSISSSTKGTRRPGTRT